MKKFLPLATLETPSTTLPANAPDNAVPIAGKTLLNAGSIANSAGKVDLLGLMKLLAEKECNNVLIESGPILAGAFMQQGLVDELVIYMAPKLLGNIARPLLSLPFTCLDEAIELDIKDIRQVGNDIRLTTQIKNLNTKVEKP